MRRIPTYLIVFVLGADLGCNRATEPDAAPTEDRDETLEQSEQNASDQASPSQSNDDVSNSDPNEDHVAHPGDDFGTTFNLSHMGQHALAVFDFNDDGLEDILVGGENYASIVEDPIVLLLGQSDGDFVDGTQVHITGTVDAASPVATAGDFNGDGVLDFAIFDAGNGELGQHPTEGGYTGGEPHLLLSTSRTSWVSSDALKNAVINADPSYCWPSCTTVIHLKHVVAGDIDGDGDLDMYVESGGGHTSPSPHFLINNGDDTFSIDASDDRRENALIWGPGSWRYASQLLVDMNGDGHLDLVMGQLRRRANNQEALTSKVVLNNGSGQFQLANAIDLPHALFDDGYTYVKSMVATDVDGDSDMDLILFHERSNLDPDPSNVGNTGRHIQILVQEAGAYSDETVGWMGNQAATEEAAVVPYGSNYNLPKAPRLLDVDQDGDLDLVCERGGSLGSHAPFVYLREGDAFVSISSASQTDGQDWYGEGAVLGHFKDANQYSFAHFDHLPGPDEQYNTSDDRADVHHVDFKLP